MSKLPPLGRVKHIQAFMPTTDHIVGQSALQVDTVEDLLSNKLGVSAWENACETCDNFMATCPGHSGHLTLPIPVYRVHFVKHLISILNCICYYCQRPRLPRESRHYDYILHTLPPENRLAYLENVSKSYKCCGRPPKTGHQHKAPLYGDDVPSHTIQGPCGKMFVLFKHEDRDATFIEATVVLSDHDKERYAKDPEWTPPEVTPQSIYECLLSLDDETCQLLGCGPHNPPEAHMWEVLPIPSLNTRPCHTYGGMGSKKRGFDDWTKFLRIIVNARNELRTLLDQGWEDISCCHYKYGDIEARSWRDCLEFNETNKTLKEAAKKRFKKQLKRTQYGGVEALWRNLVKQIAAFHSHRHKKFMHKANRYGRPLINVQERYMGQKAGMLRGHIVARRVNNAGRGVLEGGIHQAVDEVQLPRILCMQLSVKVYVNRLNLQQVQQWVLNGPYQYPGANYVTMKDGRELILQFYENRRDICLEDILFVRRHVLARDWVMVGRQPTLHRPSMMSFRVVVVDSYTIRLHYGVFPPLGADCDGDEVTVYVPQTVESQAEMATVCTVGRNIMKDGKIWIKFIQNAVVGAYLMTAPDRTFDREQVSHLTSYMLDLWDFGTPATPDGRWTGHQLVSWLFPPDFNLVTSELKIINGQFLSGRLTANTLNGSQGLLNHMYRDYKDPQVTMRFLHQGYLLFQQFLDRYGHSAGYFDCAVDPRHYDQAAFQPYVSEFTRVQRLVDRLERYSDTLTDYAPDQNDNKVEDNVRLHIGRVNEQSLRAVYNYHSHLHHTYRTGNGVLVMIDSGAKGSKNTLNQMCGVVGQIYVMHQRFPHRSAHFLANENTLAGFGFVREAFATGLSVRSIVCQAQATCESVIGKNKGTGNYGYTVRKLAICMMPVRVDHWKRAVDTRRRVVWGVYGNDGMDPQRLTTVKLRLKCAAWEVVRRHGVLYDLRALVGSVPKTEAHAWRQLFNGAASPISAEWFRQLHYFDTEDQVCVVDTTDPGWLNRLDPATRANWEVVRTQAATWRVLHQELVDLLDLRRRLVAALSRCSEAEDRSSIRAPFDFRHLFTRCRHIVGAKRPVDVLPTDYHTFTQTVWLQLLKHRLVQAHHLTFKALFFDWMSTKSLMNWGFSSAHLKWLAHHLVQLIRQSQIEPGEAVGLLASQNAGEPFSQLALKTPHFAGKFTTTVGGSARIIDVVNGKFQNAQMHLVLKKQFVRTEVEAVMFGLQLTKCYLKSILAARPTYRFTGHGIGRVCHFKFPIDRRKAILCYVSLREAVKNLCRCTGLSFNVFETSQLDEPEWYICAHIRLLDKFWKTVYQAPRGKYDSETVAAENIVYNFTNSIVVHGVPEIDNFIPEQVTLHTKAGKVRRWAVTTLGSNLARVLRHPWVDTRHSYSNDVTEMGEIFGLHAARKALVKEFTAVMSGMLDDRHIKLIARVMSSDLVIKGMKILQMGQAVPPLQRAAFEQGPQQMAEYCARGAVDQAEVICGAVLANKRLSSGTGFNLRLTSEALPVPKPLQLVHDAKPTQVCDYVFSPKADGVRYLLSFTLNDRKLPVLALVDREFQVFELPEAERVRFPALFYGTVLDGELTQVQPGGQTLFLVFDCLMICGNVTAGLRYDQRLDLAREVLYRAKEPCYTSFSSSAGTDAMAVDEEDDLVVERSVLRVSLGHDLPYVLPASLPGRSQVSHTAVEFGSLKCVVKPVFALHGVRHFLEEVVDRLPFRVDGLVFTNLTDAATPFRTSTTSLLKWKPNNSVYSENTVDFFVELRPATSLPVLQHVFSEHARAKHRWTYALSMNQVEAFRPVKGHVTLSVPYGRRKFLVFAAGEVPANVVPTRGVWECQWMYQLETWRLVRPRKKRPNQLHTVVSTLLNIVENIQVHDFTD